MKHTHMLLFVSGMLIIALGNAAAQEKPKDAAKTSDRAPFGWMQLPDKAIVLRIHQKGISAGSRQDASVLVGWVLRELTGKGVKSYLAVDFVKEEANYFRMDKSDVGVQLEINKALVAALDGFAKNQTIDWKVLDDLATKHDDQFTGQRRWPWSIGFKDDFDKKLIFLKDKNTPASSVLEIETEWTGKSGYSAAVRLPGEGLTVWNISGTLKLKDKDGKIIFEKTYRPGEEKSPYSGWGDTPSAEVRDNIITDIARGLNEPVKRLSATRPKTPLIAGSRWVLVSEGPGNSKEIVEFKNGGKSSYVANGTQYEGDGWKQDGEIVRFSANNHYAEYEGILDEPGGMSGTGRNAHSSWKWTATRMQAEK